MTKTPEQLRELALDAFIAGGPPLAVAGRVMFLFQMAIDAARAQGPMPMCDQADCLMRGKHYAPVPHHPAT